MKRISAVLFCSFALCAQPPQRTPPPKAGVCPLPTLAALPTLSETAFFTADPKAPQGTIVQPLYQNFQEADKRMHVYLPPGYKSNPEQRYPVLYLNHGGGDDDSAWIAKGSAAAILDNLIATGKAKPMIVVMPNTKTCVKAIPEKDDACTQEFVKDIIPYIDSNYRTKADRNNRAIAGLSMGGFVVMHTGLQKLDTFSELYVFSSGHINADGLQKFQDLFGPLFKDPSFNDRFRVPFYFAAGETDIALKNGQKNLAILNQHGVRNFWVLSTGGHEWGNWRRYLWQTAQIMFPDCPAVSQ